MSTSLSYRDAGVDIDAGDQLVENIKPFAKRVLCALKCWVIWAVFGTLVEIGKNTKIRYWFPVRTASAPSWKLAFDWDKHDTVGIDLVYHERQRHFGSRRRTFVLLGLFCLRQAGRCPRLM